MTKQIKASEIYISCSDSRPHYAHPYRSIDRTTKECPGVPTVCAACHVDPARPGLLTCCPTCAINLVSIKVS